MEEEMKKEQDKVNDNATIYDILKLEHKDIRKLFKQIVDENRWQDSVYMNIKNGLSVHINGEEKLFYSKLQANSETREVATEAFEEHDIGRKVLSDIDNSTDDAAKLAKVKVLSEAIDMHIKDEEDKLFKRAKNVLSNDDARAIAKQFLNEKMQNMPSSTSMPNMPMPNPNTPNPPNPPTPPTSM